MFVRVNSYKWNWWCGVFNILIDIVQFAFLPTKYENTCFSHLYNWLASHFSIFASPLRL